MLSKLILTSTITYLLSLFGQVSCSDIITFSDFIKTYNKDYSDSEISERLVIYKNNIDIINKHNNENHSWKMAVNEFTDLSQEEFKTTYNCYNKDTNRLINRKQYLNFYRDVPSEVDWTVKGAVTAVSDQKNCGSCWSFSCTEAVESAYFLSTGNLVSLSEQQLVDCSGSFGNEGCNGGLMDYGFEYIKENGICSESSYPYTGVDGTCKKCTPITKIDSYVDVTPNSELALQQAVALQPVSVAIEADTMVFQFYSTGVMNSVSCGVNLDHGVLVVGYGSLNGVDYWKVKNSWGANWGENGYILIGRNAADKQGICGIAMEPSFPVISKTL